MSMAKRSIDRWRFARNGEVVRDERRPGPTVGTDGYRTGDLLFAPRGSSPSRKQFKARRAERRASR